MVEVPRVAGRLVQAGGEAKGKFVHSELTQQDGPGLAEAGHHGGIAVGNAVFQHLGLARGADARGVVEVFKGDGYTVEGAAVVTREYLRLGLPRGIHGGIGKEGDVGLELVVDGLDAVKECLGKFDGQTVGGSLSAMAAWWMVR